LAQNNGGAGPFFVAVSPSLAASIVLLDNSLNNIAGIFQLQSAFSANGGKVCANALPPY